ncbi:hypothetical protein KC341_g91 [Hortaea werneckii]|nr:hypothetical protein KC341_g91 [Hortaea werneckii]
MRKPKRSPQERETEREGGRAAPLSVRVILPIGSSTLARRAIQGRSLIHARLPAPSAKPAIRLLGRIAAAEYVQRGRFRRLGSRTAARLVVGLGDGGGRGRGAVDLGGGRRGGDADGESGFGRGEGVVVEGFHAARVVAGEVVVVAVDVVVGG